MKKSEEKGRAEGIGSIKVRWSHFFVQNSSSVLITQFIRVSVHLTPLPPAFVQQATEEHS
jgi:hypothetical protein